MNGQPEHWNVHRTLKSPGRANCQHASVNLRSFGPALPTYYLVARALIWKSVKGHIRARDLGLQIEWEESCAKSPGPAAMGLPQ